MEERTGSGPVSSDGPRPVVLLQIYTLGKLPKPGGTQLLEDIGMKENWNSARSPKFC